MTPVKIEDATVDALGPRPVPAPSIEVVRPLVPDESAWRAYSELRRGGTGAAGAAQRVADGWPLSDAAREDLIDRLLRFEDYCGLEESVPDYLKRIKQEDADAVPVDPAVLAQQAEQAKLDAIEAEAEQHLVELREQIERLSPEALTDAAVKQELLNLHAELRQAELAVELAPMARRETARREAQAREDAQREAAAAQAVKLLSPRRKAAEALDAAAMEYCKTLSAYRGIVEQHARAVEGSGAGPAAVRRVRFETARAGLRRAAFDAGVHHHILGDLGRFQQRDVSVLEAEPAEVRASATKTKGGE